jgi:hypothetical protein
MTADFGFDADRWNEVASAVAAVSCIREVEGGAVWLIAAGGTMRFVIATADTYVEIDAGPWTGDDVSVPLSPRLIQPIDTRVDDGAVLSVVDDSTAVLRLDDIDLAIDLVSGGELPHIPNTANAVRAAVAAPLMRRAIDTVFRTPSGIDPRRLDRPPLWIGIDDDGSVSLHVDWTEHGAGRVTARVGAHAEGCARRAVVSCDIGPLLDAMTIDREAFVLLDLPDSLDGWMTISSGFTTAAVRCVDATSGRHLKALMSELDQIGFRWDLVGPRTISVDGSHTRVRIELLEGAHHTFRITTVVAGGVVANSDLLAEINELNAGLVDARLWVEDRRVIACTEVPADHVDSVLMTASALVSQMAGLGVLLGALAGGAQ